MIIAGLELSVLQYGEMVCPLRSATLWVRPPINHPTGQPGLCSLRHDLGERLAQPSVEGIDGRNRPVTHTRKLLRVHHDVPRAIPGDARGLTVVEALPREGCPHRLLDHGPPVIQQVKDPFGRVLAAGINVGLDPHLLGAGE